MSFEPIIFAYTPPPTVPNQPSEASTVAVASTTPAPTGASIQANPSVAASLAAQLGDLIDTANYLQSVITSMNPGLGVTVDSSNPDLAMALSAIYNGQVPSAVSLSMYSNTLDAELGGMQVNIAAGPNSPIEANSFQQQALTTINNSVETQFASDGSVASQSALLLRSLKAGVIMNTGIQSHLLAYPAATSTTPMTSLNVIPASTIDVSPTVAALVQTHIDTTGQVYSSMYKTLTQPDPVAADVGSVVAALATSSVTDLIRMNSMLSMTSQSLSGSVQSTSTGIGSYIYPQAATQAAGLMFQLDKIVQMAVGPNTTANNAVSVAMQALTGTMTPNGALTGVIRTMKQPSSVQLSGPLTGMPLNNSAFTGLPIGSPMPPSMSKLGFSAGINEISSLMSFCTSHASTNSALQQDAFQRLTARVSGDQGTSVQLLAVASSMASLQSLVTAFIKEQQNSAAIATQNSAGQLATVGNVLASAQTGSGSSYVVQAGVVTLTPVNVPAPTPGASVVFARSGIQSTLAGLTSKV